MNGKNVQDTRRFVEKYFTFLVSDFGFGSPTEKNVGHEFHIAFRKASIEIDVAISTDGFSIPWVTLTDYSRPAEIDMTLSANNYYPIESLEQNIKLREIHRLRNERYNPKVDRSVKGFSPDKINEAFSELYEDYQNWGRTELEDVLKESAEIIKRNKQILIGDLSAFPERKVPKEINAKIYDAKGERTEKFKSVNDFFKFISGRQRKRK